ncbi:hypothetical protein K8Z61_02450 [Nocardioides sp. TRM66260-LWL]|uniref:hypothetical protein n=1 Tax=Nocardioides sp. TRM66260-LWL TaxID=2874478 RepID=UPI001CC585BB|nr:hypothetical protein [Nocardioides sp. TRM66260-LWL]MBZ5733346.1 hypothetical protein [Nocardioides sp. TRM66260-LWL]
MSAPVDPEALGRADDWSSVRALVVGFDAAGFAAADNLLHLGAQVAVVDETARGREEQAELLEVLGARLRLEPGATTARVEDDLRDVDVVVVSPDVAADAPLPAQAHRRALPVWGEVGLAWRLRDPDAPAPWLVVAGGRPIRGVLHAAEAILRAEGLRTVVAGEEGLPLVEAVMDPVPYDALVVGLSAAQLRDAGAMSPLAAAVVAPGEDRRLGRAYGLVQEACVYRVDDPGAEVLVRDADVVEGARAIGVTLGTPTVGMLGLVEDLLVDRAFIAERATSAAELGALADVGPADVEPEQVADALVAAALARARGVPQAAVRDGLRAAAR